MLMLPTCFKFQLLLYSWFAFFFFFGRRLKSSTCLFYVPKSDISFGFKQNVIGEDVKSLDMLLQVTYWMKRN